ncbi:Predicted dehydrogenase [Phaffia rhodozyma]|uniref:Predicted dehydrogenase n=1 Tax=Phaffia rhodozyma TaxID=264483 RepID=A0A0F7SF41_PHARH|nr:Predicted dehydrogenase [Phaffia rhodozyma]
MKGRDWVPIGAILVISLGLFGQVLGSLRRRKPSPLSLRKERVLVLGASSGIGKEIALQYASRGASICLVSRSLSNIALVSAECEAVLQSNDPSGSNEKVICLAEDVSDVEGMLRVRETLRTQFGGIDTVHIVAGVLTTRPFFSLAGLGRSASQTPGQGLLIEQEQNKAGSRRMTEKEGIERVVDVARQSMETNFMGPLVSYATFVPLLSETSTSPTIALLSSVAALLPAPTRSIYASSKSAAQALFQTLAVESELQGLGVQFLSVVAGSVRTDLRKRALDVSPIGNNPKEDEEVKWVIGPREVALKLTAEVDRLRGMREGDKKERLTGEILWIPEKPYKYAQWL